MAESILIIEDDELMRASLELELEGAGYAVASACNGLEAIALARDRHFDLIVSDVRMEGMSGLEALSELRSTQPAARRIVITGYANPDAPITALKMGVDDYLLKPFSSEEFLRSVRTALEQMRRGARSDLAVRELLLSVADGAVRPGVEERVQRCLAAARAHGFGFGRTRALRLAALLAEVDPALVDRLDELRPLAGWLRMSRNPQGEDLPLEALILAGLSSESSRNEGRRQARGVGSNLEGLEGSSDEGERQSRGAGSKPDGLEGRRDEVAGGSSRSGVAGSNPEGLGSSRDETSLRSHEADVAGQTLARLADTYRALNQLDLAERAYAEAALLLTEPEDALPLSLERAELDRLRGRQAEALDRARAVSQQASEHGLDLVFARAELTRARLADPQAALPRAVEVFRRWELRAELSRALLLLPEPPIEELLALLSDWQGEWREEVLAVLGRSLERSHRVEEIARFLKRAGQPLVAELRRHPQARVRLLLDELVPSGTAPASDGYQLRLLGRFLLRRSGEALEEEVWPTRKIRHLFAYLAFMRGRPAEEETLAALFWSTDKARHSLHNAISSVRKILGASTWLVKKRGGYLILPEAPLVVDVEDFVAAESRGRQLAARGLLTQALPDLQRADRLYQGDFLEGEYPEWADPVRLDLRTRHLEVLSWLGRHFYRQGKPEVAQESFRKMLQRDNCSEDAYLGLMACQLAQQQTADAIKTYHQCTRSLQSELNLPPPPRLLELYLRIVDGSSQPVEL